MTREEEHFSELVASLLRDPRVSRSTMMGLPCLRYDGAFFASLDRRSDHLVVKLAETRVDELIAAGQAGPFEPAGRRFRQWATIDAAHQHLWIGYLDQALQYAAGP